MIDVPDIRCWSLVVRANPELPMSQDRMLEGTEAVIRQELSKLIGCNIPENRGFYNSDLLRLLASFPVVMTREFDVDDEVVEAVVGYMDFASLNPKISHPVMRIKSCVLIDRGFLDEWYCHRTRWTVFRGNPFRELAEYAMTPNVAGKDVNVKSEQVAVMMPFDEGSANENPVYEAIRDGVSKAGLNCIRSDDLKSPSIITDDIRRLIHESGTILVDLTGLKANVMFEFGYAHACGKPVYLITADDLNDLPFDIRQRRVISYSRMDNGLAKLAADVADYLSDSSRASIL